MVTTTAGSRLVRSRTVAMTRNSSSLACAISVCSESPTKSLIQGGPVACIVILLEAVQRRAGDGGGDHLRRHLRRPASGVCGGVAARVGVGRAAGRGIANGEAA